ncbi:MAG TPA: MFS transporter [Pseudonocardiaceae bacterium]|nr:MFS transporter [Pseudonocardiaceae bacterium]
MLAVPPLLRQRTFRRFWLGESVSLFGDEIMNLALPLTAVLVLHANAAEMGYLTAVGILPNLLFALAIGAWVDRHGRRRRIMIVSDLARAGLLVSVPVCVVAGVLGMPVLYGVAFAVGVFEVFFAVSYNTLFVAMVPAARYVEGNALLNGSRAIAGVGGQSLGGLIVALLTAPFAVFVNAASFLVSAFFLCRIRPDEPAPEPGGRGHVVAGLRFIVNSPVLRASLGATATVNLFTFAYFAELILFVTSQLRVSALQLGLALGAGAVGTVLAAGVIRRWTAKLGLGLVFTVGFLAYTVPIALVPLAHGPKPLVLALLFLAEFGSGFGVMMIDVAGGAIQLGATPDRLRARVSGAYRMVNYGTRPLGAVFGGLLGSAIGLRPTLWVAVIGAACSVLWLLPSPIPTMRECQQVV